MHYLYTKEGAAEAMGLKTVNEITRYIKKAKKIGLQPSKLQGGIEYYDLEMLKNPLAYAVKQQKKETEEFVAKQVFEHQGETRIQPTLF